MICVSIAPKNMKEARSLLIKAGELADVVEIRVENIVDLDIEHLLFQPRPDVIITNRPSIPTKSGSEKKRIALLYKAIKAGAEYVDIERTAGKIVVSDIVRFASQCKTQVIISYHNFSHTSSEDILDVYIRLKAARPHIIKLVTYANKIYDNLRIFNLLQTAIKGHYRMSCFCMGEKGEISRILAPRFGGYITYCSLDEGDETAPGQIPVKKLLDVYNYRSINEQTKIFGLVGNPVSHSRGIYIHNKYFKQNNLNAVYVNFLADDFGNFFSAYSKYLQGLSVTIPHKEKATRLMESRSYEAEATGSVNTIIKEADSFKGYNTDALAAVLIFEKLLNGKSVAVLGTGGTARSAIYAAKKCGASVHIFGRDLKKANMLALNFECEYSPFDEIQKIKFMDVIINTTPVGMEPDSDASPIPQNLLNKEMLVVDFVYTPEITKLLSDAHQCGCQIIPGTKIFETQAKLQQELFKSVI
ncbi:MAG: type I 3-dehydroquinate dehydratase [Bacteroidota bacterium]|nr:type I 3-dehydroquinate dehydratase [Bacteroidota bacterium]